MRRLSLPILVAGLVGLPSCCSLFDGHQDDGRSGEAGDAGPDAGAPRWQDAGACIAGPTSSLTHAARYTPSIAQLIATADLNGDGLLDLLAANGSGLEVFFGQSDGGLSGPTSYDGLAGQYARAIVGDINGDGFPDVVLSVSFPETFEVLLNDGNGKLTRHGGPSAPPNIFIPLGVGDLNSDGHADLVVESAPSGTIDGIAVLYGDGAGDFGAPIPIPGIGAGAADLSFALGDLNQDGLPDIVADSPDGSLLVVLINHGDGGFSSTPYTTPALGAIVLLPRAGAPDLVIGEGYAGYDQGVQVLRNFGDGTFALGPSYAVPGGALLAVGDFNGDCIPDVASSFDENCGETTVAIGVLFGDGDGGFSDPLTLQGFGSAPSSLGVLGPVENPRALAVGDLCGAGIAVFGDASR